MATDRTPLILIVDDDYDFLEMNRLVLEREGYRVVTAADPAQALRMMAGEKPDLVITDLMMTSLDSGFSFARAIKEHPPYAGTPVIVATSISAALGLDFRPHSEEDKAKMNADAYFDKPLDPERLLAAVAELLARRPAAGAAGPRPAEDESPAPDDQRGAGAAGA